MTYRLQFLPKAKKEWNKLAPQIRDKFKKKLKERLEAPRVPSAALSSLKDCYKIKLHSDGYRLVYQVQDDAVVLLIVAVGKRENNEVYEDAHKRIN